VEATELQLAVATAGQEKLADQEHESWAPEALTLPLPSGQTPDTCAVLPLTVTCPGNWVLEAWPALGVKATVVVPTQVPAMFGSTGAAGVDPQAEMLNTPTTDIASSSPLPRDC
jgi:hypothetical protein